MSAKTSSSPLNRLSSIRAQLIIGFGLILVLALIIAIIGYVSLTTVQANTERTINEASQIRELSLKVENEFLLARQNEVQFLEAWRTIGFETAKANNVSVNQAQLAAARADLGRIEQLLQNTNDPELQQTLTQVQQLAPLFDEYETTFLATVDQIETRSQANGIEQTLQTQRTELEAITEPLVNNTFYQLVLQLSATEQTYFSTGQQQYIDTIRLLVNQLEDLSQTSPLIAPDAQPVITEEGFTRRTTAYFETFEELITLDQEIQINTETFRDVTREINLLTTQIGADGQTGLERSLNQLESISQRSTTALIIGAILALLIGATTATLLGSRIIGRLNYLQQAAEKIGEGDLSQTVTLTGNDEFVVLANVFNDMTSQLQGLVGSLEQQVADRTRGLEIVSQISERLNAILSLNELLLELVHQLQDEFGYYHAHIYLLDDHKTQLLMVEGTGEAGAQMKQQGHSIPLDAETSLVARAARSGKAVRIEDVRETSDWLPNPLLPQTNSEIAVPIILNEAVVGVLDVQDDQVGGLDEGDANLLRSLANQIAVAI
ncbi:MAG: GAF domain-containing protein, partial [Chloroflexota bacterium]